MSTRRRGRGGVPGSDATSSGSAPSLKATQALPSESGWKWFHVYYAILCTATMGFIAVWFIFLRSPYRSHPSYDPLTFLPVGTANTILLWSQRHATPTPTTGGATSGSASGALLTPACNDLPELLEFLARYEQQGHFDSPSIRGFEHYVEAMVNGWIAGVFETLTLDPHALAAIAEEEGGVGSIPGGSRRLRARVEGAVASVVDLLADGDSTSTTGTSLANRTHFQQLQPDHQNWIYEGLSHCHTTACRLVKMTLMTRWRDNIALFPEHEHKDKWTMLTQLFHPDTHPYKLIDAPATVDTLCSLWFRFFATGDMAYIERLLELTRITGAPAYQAEKDREIREWTSKKYDRADADARDKWTALKEQALKQGVAPPSEPAPVKRRKLPPSPTRELHTHFFNAFLYYADEHPTIKDVVRDEIETRPNDPINRALAETTPFKVQEEEQQL